MLAALSIYAVLGIAALTPQSEKIEFRGNEVITEEVYWQVLEYAGYLSAPLEPAAKAAWIQSRVSQFLIKSGYELAVVSAAADGEKIVVEIDEGHLDKILIINTDSWTAIQLRFLFELPGRVFNRPLLERKIRAVLEETNIVSAYYKIAPTDTVEHRGYQLEDPDIIRGVSFLKPGEPHELRIYLKKGDWSQGIKAGLGYKAPDGIYLNGELRYPRFIIDNDSLRLKANFGVRPSGFGKVPGNPIGISSAGFLGKWMSPKIIDDLRTAVLLSASLEARPREDISLLGYFYAPIRLGGQLEYELGLLNLSLGAGIEQRFMFSPDIVEGEMAPILAVTDRSDLQLFVRGTASLWFNKQSLRRDRMHRIDLMAEGSLSLINSTENMYRLQLDYQVNKMLGFDEARLKFKSLWMNGGVPFYLEQAMGQGFLRAAFLGEIYNRKATALRLAYRFSLSRDTLKLGLFNDAVIYEGLDKLRQDTGVQFIDNLGVSLHFLIYDTFQFDIYAGAGLSTEGEVSPGASIHVIQAF